MRIDDAHRSPSSEPEETSMLEATSDLEAIEAPAASAILPQRGQETRRVEPWGRNSVRVRVSRGPLRDDGLGALLSMPSTSGTESVERNCARLVVDDVDEVGRLRFSRASDGEEVLAEEPLRFLWPDSRSFVANGNGYYRVEQQFRAYPSERLFGLGSARHR